MEGRRAGISQQTRELRHIIALQEQEKKFFTQLSEERLGQNRRLLPRLRGAVQEDIRALGVAQKRDQFIISEAFRAQKHSGIVFSGKTVQDEFVPTQGAQKVLQSSIFGRVNTCNALLYEVRRRSQTLDAQQRRLQQLEQQLNIELNSKQRQEQVQTIRQLENSIEKMLVKIHAGQKVTALYLALRDALKRELLYLPLHVDLLHEMAKVYHGELQDMQLKALDALKASNITKEKLAKAEREPKHFPAAQKVQIDRNWLKAATGKHLRAEARYNLAMDFPSELSSDLEDSRTQMEHEAFVTAEMEKAKAVVQCSCLWDIAGRLLAQQKTTADMEQHFRACEEKQRALKGTLRELELKLAELKLHPSPSAISCREPEAELRASLQQEEARLEQARAQCLRNQELLLQIENAVDNLFIRLYGVNVPEQDVSVEFKGVDEKLRYCEQKLQHLVQRVASLPAHSYSLNKDNKVFVEVRNSLEKAIASEPQNLRIPLEDAGSEIQNTFDFLDKDRNLVLTREDIKKQGLRLTESKRKSSKRK